VLAGFRRHGESKTEDEADRFDPEVRRIQERHLHELTPRERWLAKNVAWRGHEARRLRWSAWEHAVRGEVLPCAGRWLKALCTGPWLTLQPRTWAVPPVAIVQGILSLVGGHRNESAPGNE
jgi:hypothetical protein